MANPIPLFYTYDNTSRAIISLFTTANAATAAAGAGQTAWTTGETEAQDINGNTVDSGLAEPSTWYHADAAPRIREGSYNPYPLRKIYRDYHNRLQALHFITESDEVVANHDPTHVQFAQRVIFGMHEACWSVHFDVRLNAADEIRWHQFQALGPADGTLATTEIVSPADSNAKFGLTLPTGLAFGADGNEWEVTVQRGGADSFIIDRDDMSIDFTLTGTKTLAQVEALLRANALFSGDNAGNLVITGNGALGFPIPASQSTVQAYPFTGGTFIYNRAMPQTFADVVSLLTEEEFNDAVFRSLSFVEYDADLGSIGSRVMTRRTLHTATTLNNDVAYLDAGRRKVFPTVFDLRNGDWIDGIME